MRQRARPLNRRATTNGTEMRRWNQFAIGTGADLPGEAIQVAVDEHFLRAIVFHGRLQPSAYSYQRLKKMNLVWVWLDISSACRYQPQDHYSLDNGEAHCLCKCLPKLVWFFASFSKRAFYPELFNTTCGQFRQPLVRLLGKLDETAQYCDRPTSISAESKVV